MAGICDAETGRGKPWAGASTALERVDGIGVARSGDAAAAGGSSDIGRKHKAADGVRRPREERADAWLGTGIMMYHAGTRAAGMPQEARCRG